MSLLMVSRASRQRLLIPKHWDMKHLAHKSFLWRGSYRSQPWILAVRGMASQPASQEGQQVQNSTTRWQRWQPCETLVLVAAKKQVLEAQNIGAKRTKEQWEEIESFCEKNGVQRTADQCKQKWERLMLIYTKIIDWERKRSREKTSFWVMDQDEKKAEGLHFIIDRKTFDALNDFLSKLALVENDDILSLRRVDCNNENSVQVKETVTAEGDCHTLQQKSVEGDCHALAEVSFSQAGCSNDSTSQQQAVEDEDEELGEGLHDAQLGGVFHLEETAELSNIEDANGSVVKSFERTQSQESSTTARSGNSVDRLLDVEKSDCLRNDLKTVFEDVNSGKGIVLEQHEFGMFGDVCEKAANLTENELGMTAGLNVLNVQNGELKGGNLDCSRKNMLNAQDSRLMKESLESQELPEGLGVSQCLDVPPAVEAIGLNKEGSKVASVDVNECVKSQDSSLRINRMTNDIHQNTFEKGTILIDTNLRVGGVTEFVNVDEGKEGAVVLDDAHVHSHSVISSVMTDSMTSESGATNAEEVTVEDGEFRESNSLGSVRESPENLTRAEGMQHNLYRELHDTEPSDGLCMREAIGNVEEQHKAESAGGICERHKKEQDLVSQLQALNAGASAVQGGEMPEMPKHVSDFVESDHEQPHAELKKSERKDSTGTAVASMLDDSSVGVPHPDCVGNSEALKVGGTGTEGMFGDKDKGSSINQLHSNVSSLIIDSGVVIASTTDEASLGVTYPGALDITEAVKEAAKCTNGMDGDPNDQNGLDNQLELERSVRSLTNNTSLGSERTGAVREHLIEHPSNSANAVINKKEDVITLEEGLQADADAEVEMPVRDRSVKVDDIVGTGIPKESKYKESGGTKVTKQTNDYEDDLFTSMQASISNAIRNISEMLGSFFKRS